MSKINLSPLADRVIVKPLEAEEKTKGGIILPDTVKEKPTVIIANTVKGKCISFAENNAAFHNAAMTAEQCEIAINDLKKLRR